MFTGIVTDVGSVREASKRTGSARLRIASDSLSREVAVGDSVAVDGACLTVTSTAPPDMTFDVVTETLDRTTLGDLRPGDSVNLEGALRVGDRLSGHFVMGHVDGVGTVVIAREEAGQTVIRIRAPDSVTPYLLEKGSIAVNGVSLTIWDVASGEFSVALVPHTLSATTLGGMKRGDRVNLEADVLARWIAKTYAPPAGGGLTLEKLRDAGYEV